jgi:signal transduction histidine kinase
MGGSIELDNRPEGGARAVVSLPLEEERARATVRLPLDAYKDMEKGS